MILDFRAKDYKCTYYAGKRLHEDLCFSDGYDGGEINGYAHATIIWSRNKQDQLNYCVFDEKTLIEYFMEISKLLGFTLISFTKEKKLYKLQIKCALNSRYFIYIATYIRYVYEHPFEILLYAAWQNRKNLPELNIIQIMQFYLAVFFNGRRCHCPGLDQLAFYNINSKCQFNLIRDNFNRKKYFIEILSKHTDLCNNLYIFNSKQLPQIASGINFIANKYYGKNKKNLCRW